MTSETIPIDVAARFFVSLDRMHVFETRAATKDEDFITLGCQLGDGEPLTAPPTGKPWYMPNVGGGYHRIDLAVGPIEFVPGKENERLYVVFFIANLGFAGSSAEKGIQVLDAFTGMASGALGAAVGGGGSGGSWTTLAGGTKELHQVWVNQGKGADGLIADVTMSIGMSLLDDLTFPTGSHEYPVDCHGVISGDGTGNVKPSHYRVVLKVHRQATVYQVNVTTGDVPDAETDSHVFITIRGERGSTEEQKLDDMHRNFQRGPTESFRVVGKDLGKITGIRIRHDNTNDDKSWFLQDVTVEDTYFGQHAIFKYNNWLSKRVGPQTFDVELTPN